MIDQDVSFVEKRRQFYQLHYREAEPIDHWHAYAQNVVHRTTRQWFATMGSSRGSRVLNAGSGGSDYGITSPVIHLDLVPERINQFPGFIVADISNIPTLDSSFDVVICVGSVINYANPILGIGEFSRILCPGGLLILEYERSGSPEYWMKHGCSSPCVRVDTFYGKVKTELWAYSDQFVDGILAMNRFRKLAESRFHGLSSVALALTNSPRFASRCICADQLLSNRWPLRHLTSNRILAVEKLAD